MSDRVVPLPVWGTVELADDGQQPVTHLFLSGELDIADVPRLLTTFDVLIDEGVRQVDVNLDAVTFIDAAVLGALVHASNRLAGVGGALVLTCSSSQPCRVLHLARLEHLVAPAACP